MPAMQPGGRTTHSRCRRHAARSSVGELHAISAATQTATCTHAPPDAVAVLVGVELGRALQQGLQLLHQRPRATAPCAAVPTRTACHVPMPAGVASVHKAVGTGRRAAVPHVAQRLVGRQAAGCRLHCGSCCDTICRCWCHIRTDGGGRVGDGPSGCTCGCGGWRSR